MYFSFPRSKVMLMAALTLVMIFAVSLTFEAKTTLYGESRIGQIIGRTISSGYRTITYSLRERASRGGLLAAVIGAPDEEKAAGDAAEAIPVLTYHAIVARSESGEVSPESFEGHNVSLENFEDQMFALKEAGWDTLTLDEFNAFIQGDRELPEKSFLLTFDDGAKESYYPVDPLLKVLDYEAVTFILPEYSKESGTYYYLSEGELRRMIESDRWQIGSHGTHSHQFISLDAEGSQGAALANKAWLEEAQRLETDAEYQVRVADDLAHSRERLERMFDVPVSAFAFPFGEFGQLSQNYAGAMDVVTQTAEDIYDLSFYQWWTGEGFTFNYPEGQHMVKRISVRAEWSGEELLDRLSDGVPKQLPYSDDLDTDNGWLTTWGDFSIDSGKLFIGAEPETSGASMILDGSRHWEDYHVTMQVESPNQTGVFVWVRFQDNENNAACNLGNGFAHVEQVIDGEHRVIAGNNVSESAIPSGTYSIDITVEDRTVTCGINDTELVRTTFLDESLDRGGIGVKVWDRTLGRAALNIEQLTVETIKSPE